MIVYRFYCTLDSSVTREVFPLNFYETTLVDELQSGQKFYRRKFSGTLLFGSNSTAIDDSGAEVNRKDDFDFFWDLEIVDPCGRIDFLITRNGAVYWEGFFSTTDGTLDLDKCTFSVTPLVSDDYSVFDEHGDAEYSLLECSYVTSNMTRKGVTYAYDRCHYLIDVITHLAYQIAGASVTSHFLSDAVNYVTLGTNHYNYITIAQKSDIKRWDSSDPATIVQMSWNDLMNILKALNLAWVYDGTTVTIEHVSYFNSGLGEDLRSQKLSASSNKYSYVKESLPKYENFSWMEYGNDEFWPHTIYYESACVNQESGNNSTSYSCNVTTDIQYIQDCMANPIDPTTYKPENISDDGFVLLANYLSGGSLYVYMTALPVRSTYYNNDLSWGVLHKALFRHERILLEGYMNGILSTFVSAKKTKKQEVSAVICTPFDPSLKITTELGETYLGGVKGSVQTATISPTGLIKFDLRYGPGDNVNTGFSYGKGMVVTEVRYSSPRRTTYTALLTEPADIDLDLKLRLLIEDSLGATCITAWFDLIVLTGATTGTMTINWCDPGTPPSKISIHNWDPTGIPGWTYTVVYDPAVYVLA